MMAQHGTGTSHRRVVEAGKRNATELENGELRLVIADKGGMTPELSTRRGSGWMNAHWIPEFRDNSGEPFDQARHGGHWGADLLYSIAGNFPCCPNFGPDHDDGGIFYPPHGWTANGTWRHEAGGVDAESGAAWALSTMGSPEAALPLSFRKLDVLQKGQRVHYASLAISNDGDRDAEICVAWHSTVGAPFLHAGARISVSAKRFATPPAGGEFDDTGRLAVGAEFDSLEAAPLRAGGTCDLTVVPGMIGYTDFVTGAVPRDLPLGWTAVSDPASATVYACFFPGPKAAGEDGIALSFNDLWMQYGGRPFTPWAAYPGGADRSFCLGTENAVGIYANGLAAAKKAREFMGSPTTVLVPARSRRTLRYGTLFAPYGEGALDGGVAEITPERGKLVLVGRSSKGATARFPVDSDFSVLRGLEKRLG